ncbi:MAG: GTPase Era [candidate division KSB1 bacterium]|nr:GTPase Era [candidate division KSB1 bacterium]MDZ7334771.1 GTPase Era [candidate division KSB1 bacterium]MDZ7357177.1 GTPase Era [candidate division KSB1 bacterium]MDZ7375088.1 GTPase Era [candidate division KSB1 bacterium]MDZ7398585.1 GTPase Era [candidate division KSB1 bacterium]
MNKNQQPQSATSLNIGSDFKAGYVALIGPPNVGKSTLMNALLGQKLSIVTPKPQTTRHRVLGIVTGVDHQIIFLDTPGLLIPRYKLQEKMVKAARTAISEADVLLAMIEPEESISEPNRSMLSELVKHKKPIILAINKIDLIPKDRLLPMIAAYSQAFRLDEIIPISALKLDGLDRLQQLLLKYLPVGLPFYPEDMITDQPERFFVAELIREKIFEKYGEEIPYSTAVTIEEFKEREQGKDYIRAVIYVERDSQKAIIIGRQGMALKQVGQLAREEIELFLGRPVYLELFVKVKEKWRQKETVLRELGFS